MTSGPGGTGFGVGEATWRARLGTLRQVVRQEIVARQVAVHVPDLPVRTVLDVGCGQGTQALALARRGHQVTGLDRSATLLADLRAALAEEPAQVRERVRTVEADVSDAPTLFPAGSFDVVLCHGVLMYFDDPQPVLHALARVLSEGGLLSLLVRNGDALALRPGLAGDFDAARAAFDGAAYVNRIGATARGDRLDELTDRLRREGLTVETWYGVRAFTDQAADDAPLPAPDRLDLVLECEELAGRTDPYRAVAALTHVVARRT